MSFFRILFQRTSRWKYWFLFRFAFRLALVLTALFLVRAFLFRVQFYYGGQGFPAVRDGDLLGVSVITRSRAAAGDLVLYRSGEAVCCGRVIACREGDCVSIEERGIFVNGLLLDEDAFYPTDPASCTVPLPVTLSAGEVFVLNDYRPDNSDSRTCGAVSSDDLIGVVILIIRTRGF